MGFYIGGIILLVVAVIFFIIQKKRSGKLHHIEYNDTTSINQIVENHNEMSGSFGPGSFSLYSEVKGIATANTPIKTEFSHQECVYYKSTVTREYEVLEKTKDASGKSSKRWVRKSEVVANNENKSHDFMIRDNSGEILLNTEGSELHAKKTFSKFEEGDDAPKGGLNISIGSFSISSGSNYRTIGYKYEEYAIPTKTPLYVIGDANDRSGRLQISKPTDKRPFIVSTKSEDEITKQLSSSAKWMFYGAIGCAVAAGTLIVIGVIKSF
ncbi:MAG: E3 ubiquitin ligase family protein [Flavobacteriales bacterium]|jgi:hypothetical protein|nr:E3 ubiquitin ligase family protein [Flavobacteriales bacterium]